MQALAVRTGDGLRDAIRMVRGLADHPERVATLRLQGGSEIIVIERGSGREGELVAVRLMPERRVALGRLVRANGHMRCQLVNPKGTPRDLGSGVEVLGRVLSVIRPS